MSTWRLIIFVLGWSITLGEFPSKFLKCSFDICIRSSLLSAFSFALEVLFLLLTSFIVCHAIRGYLSSTEFLILLIWPWMYSFCYVFVSSLCAFLSFCALVFVEFLLIHKDVVISFFQTDSVSHGALHYFLVLLVCILLLFPCCH